MMSFSPFLTLFSTSISITHFAFTFLILKGFITHSSITLKSSSKKTARKLKKTKKEWMQSASSILSIMAESFGIPLLNMSPIYLLKPVSTTRFSIKTLPSSLRTFTKVDFTKVLKSLGYEVG